MVKGLCLISTNLWLPLGLLSGQGQHSLLWVPSCRPLASVSSGGHGHWGLWGGREGGVVTLWPPLLGRTLLLHLCQAALRDGNN